MEGAKGGPILVRGKIEFVDMDFWIGIEGGGRMGGGRLALVCDMGRR